MLLTHDQIKAEIASGGITAISLDTTVFDKSQNRFEHAPLSQLQQFCGRGFRFLLSDVVVGEVKSHVIRDAKDSASKVQAAIKTTGQTWQTLPDVRDAAMGTLFRGETPEAMCLRRFGAFAAGTGMTVVQSGPLVSIDRLLVDYFASAPPFATNAVKKSEFPDAIALHALEKWATEQTTKVLVVSKDGDWRAFCEKSAVLVAVGELSDALSLFHGAATKMCSLVSEAISNKRIDIDAEIKAAVQSAAEYLDFVPEASAAYYYEPFLDLVEVEDFELLPIGQEGNLLLKPVDHDTDYLVAEAQVRVTLLVTTSFSFSVTDPIDRDEMPIGSASASESIELLVRVFLTFEGDFAKAPELVSVEAEFDSKSYRIDFGEVEPGWGRDE